MGEMNLRVLHIINNLGAGGAERLVAEIIPLLNEVENVQADLLLLTNKNNVFDRILKENNSRIDIVQLNNIYNPLNIWKIKKHVINGKYDIVHSHLFPTQY